MKRAIIICTLPLALVGCGQSGAYVPQPAEKVTDASYKPGQERDLFPLKEGNQWVYTIESSQGNAEMTLRVDSVRQEGDTTYATIVGTASGQPPSTSEWKVDNTGIYQISDGPDHKFDPPSLVVAFPLEKGKDVATTTNGPLPAGGGSGAIKSTIRYVGPQQCDTDMDRRLGALAIDSASTWSVEGGQGASRALTWWTPGIGFVRQRQEIALPQGRGVILMKLKSYSFK